MTKPQNGIRGVSSRIRRAAAGPATLVRRSREQAQQLKALQAELAELQAALRRRGVEQSRVSVQMGAFEERMGRLEERLGSGALATTATSGAVDDATVAEVRELLESLRREQEQTRVRMQIVSHYEERLRRVEETLSQLYDGDMRQRV